MGGLWMLEQSILSGLLIGSLYSLLAVGLTIIFGVMKMVNFSQGECLMVGMYITYLLNRVWTGNLYVLIIPVAILMFGLGLLLFKISIKRIIGRDGTSFVVLTMGLAFVLECVVQLIFKSDYRTIICDFKEKYLFLGGFSIHYPKVIAAAVMLVFVVGVFVFLRKTDMGRAMRATAENTEVAQMLGINTERTFAIAFALGIMFAGITGLLLTPIYYIYPTVGSGFKTVAMVVVVLGGLGNILGALVGGLLVGVLETIIGTFIASDLSPIGGFIVLLFVLVFKPDGIFGKEARKA